MRHRLLVVTALLAVGSPLAAQGGGSSSNNSSSSDMSLSLRFGTLGIGVELSKLLSDHFGVRVGGNYFSLNQTATKSNISYNATLKLQAITGLVDWFPAARGGFHVTAGVISNPLTFSGVGQPNNGTMTINNDQYTAAQVGNLDASIKYASVSPYFGFGFGTPAGRSGAWRFMVDIGAAIGKPTVALNAKGSAPGLATDLAAQQATMQTSANKDPVWPAISLGIGYRF